MKNKITYKYNNGTEDTYLVEINENFEREWVSYKKGEKDGFITGIIAGICLGLILGGILFTIVLTSTL